MKPVVFDEANILVCPPEGVEGIKIPMWRGHLESGEPVIVSSWELSDEEVAEIVKNKRLWVVEHGEMHHPMAFTPTKPIENRTAPELNISSSHWEPPKAPEIVPPGTEAGGMSITIPSSFDGNG